MLPTLPNCPGGGGGAPLVPSIISVVLVEETNAGDTSRPECPGGGATPVAASRRIRTDDVSDTAELSRGWGGGSVGPLQNAGDTSRPECPCDDQEKQPLAGTNRPLGGTVSDVDTRSPCGGGGGALPPSGTAGGLLPVDVTEYQLCLLRDVGRFPRGFRWCWSMVPWLGTREDEYWRPRAGETRAAGVSVGGGDAGLPRAGETLSSPDVAGRSLPVVPAGGSSSVGAADPAGPVGPCVTLSPLFPDALGPLEHSVLDHAGPVGRHVAVGPVGPDETLQGLDPLEHSDLDHADPAGQRAAVGQVGLFGTWSPSDRHPAGPAGPYVAGGPVGSDDSLQVLDPLEHSVLDHANPAGQRAAVGLVGLFGTRSPSDCHPAGPAGPYVAGALLAQMKSFKFWIRLSIRIRTMLNRLASMLFSRMFWSR